MKERFARLREAVALIQQLWSEERVSFAGEYLQDRERHDLRPAQEAGADLRGGGGPPGRQVCRPRRRRLHLHQRQGAELYTETLLPNVAGRRRGQRPSAGRHRPHDRDEGVVRHRPASGRWRIRGIGRRWRCRPRKRCRSRTRWRWRRLADALPVERAASRWIVSTDADEHVEKIARLCRVSASAIWCFTRRDPDQKRFLQAVCGAVLPRLRERFG